MEGMRMKARIFAILLTVGAAAAGGYWMWSGGGKPTQTTQGPGAAKGPPPVPVVIQVAEIKATPERFATIGAASPIAAIAIKSRIESIVDAIHFTEGQEVKAGDLLFTLDDRSLKAQLAQAEANLERDRAQLDKAQGDVRRYTELVRRDAVARQQFEAAMSAAAALEGTVKATEAAIQSAKVALGYTRLYAPMDGRSGAVSARPGSSVRPADSGALVTLTQLRPINVQFNIPERYLTQVRQAMAAGEVAVQAAATGEDGPPEQGRLVFIDSQVDVQSGTILAKAEFPNAQTRLWPGQFCDVSIILRMEENALTVPAEAVMTGQDGRFVFVVNNDNKAEVRKVTMTRTDAGVAVIAAGLRPGEKIVTDGQSRLIPGSTVIPRGAGQGGQGQGQPQTGKPPGAAS
jgi:membrane fusion protein, multidrug efflux system